MAKQDWARVIDIRLLQESQILFAGEAQCRGETTK